MSAHPRSSLPTTRLSPNWLDHVHAWMVTVDHKKLGIMYIASGLIFFLAGGLEALAIRAQLAVPGNDFLGPILYNQMFTMHGTTMVFLVGMPVLLGFGNYLVPLMIGTRDMAFPRLNAYGFWLFLFGAILLYFSFIGSSALYGAPRGPAGGAVFGAPDVGWFAYTPLTERTFSRGNSTDYWILGIFVSGFGSMATGLNLITTILCLRCKGMTLMRMPLLCWMMLVTGVLVITAIPVLTAAQVMLLFDRSLDAHGSLMSRGEGLRCCGRTSSGSSDTPRSTSSCSQPLASFRRSCRSSVAR